jgi:hypothetical protein
VATIDRSGSHACVHSKARARDGARRSAGARAFRSRVPRRSGSPATRRSASATPTIAAHDCQRRARATGRSPGRFCRSGGSAATHHAAGCRAMACFFIRRPNARRSF